jgi:hypothetical protein
MAERVASVRSTKLPPAVPGEHLWVVLVVHRLDPREAAQAASEGVSFLLTPETALTAEGPGCLWCELPWHEAAGRPCAGPA